MAPAEVGRYLGYWRLTGPHMRRKFGQRVWCHVQVVDPSSEEVAIKEADLDKALAEINRKKSALVAAKKAANADEPNDDDDNDDAGPAAAAAEAVPAAAVDVSDPMTEAPTALAEGVALVAPKPTGSPAPSEDGILVDEAMAAAPEVATTSGHSPLATTTNQNGKAPMVAASAAPPVTAEAVKAALGAMGFTDAPLVEAVITKHGADLEACARDLAAASEWDALLDDLAEMGFEDAELNKRLMLKHNGNVKRTVKELVEDA